ncbi:hypothetical protein ACFL2R_00445 [Patescibacteria group bacterium]
MFLILQLYCGITRCSTLTTINANYANEKESGMIIRKVEASKKAVVSYLINRTNEWAKGFDANLNPAYLEKNIVIFSSNFSGAASQKCFWVSRPGSFHAGGLNWRGEYKVYIHDRSGERIYRQVKSVYRPATEEEIRAFVTDDFLKNANRTDDIIL